MYLTVREILDIPALSELELVAGAGLEGLNRKVAQVSVLEVVGGPRQWWRGDELFMTTFHVLHDASCAAHVEVVRTLVEHNAAALILHPGLLGHRCLPELRAVADELEFPLILMPGDMPYAVVTDAVMGGLLGRQAAFLERSAAVNRELIQVSLEGGNLDDICRTVALRIHQPVAVVTASGGEVLAHSGQASDPESLLSDLLEHRVTSALTAQTTSVPAPTSLNTRDLGHLQKTSVVSGHRGVKQVAAPVSTRDEICAYLITWEAYGPLSELDFTVLAHACTAIGLEVLKQRAVTEAEHKLRHGFYSAALSGELHSIEDAAHWAGRARVNLAAEYIVAVVAGTGYLPSEALREIQRWEGSVAVPHDHSVAIVFRVPAGHRTPMDGAEQILTSVAGIIGESVHRSGIGMSQVVGGILELPAAFIQARVAASLTEYLAVDNRPLRYDQLGIFQLLFELRSLDPLSKYLKETLGPLIAVRGAAELIETLEVYLDAGCSHVATAGILQVHPNTIKYRIGRVKHLLGDQILNNPARRLGLHVALKARRVVA